jgi:DNA (cytosine-5)-methyltransferase 1
MIKGISLFANAGIAETYLKEVGVDIVLANELVERRALFYKHLYPECDVITGDITDSAIFDRIISRAKELQVEFLIATPPCQGMSIAGLMNPYDERNSLVKYAIDAIKKIQPKFVLLENVPRQMVTPIFYKGEELLIPEYISRRLSDCYNICINPQINTADYGIPQRRERAIFLMTRKDCMCSWTFPDKETSQINLG